MPRTVYRRPTAGLTFADKASHLLNHVIYGDLSNFPRFENYFLKPQIQNELTRAISEALEANEYQQEDWLLRVQAFGKAKSRLKHLLILTDTATERHYLAPDQAGRWQGAIEELIRILCGLIRAARRNKG